MYYLYLFSEAYEKEERRRRKLASRGSVSRRPASRPKKRKRRRGKRRAQSYADPILNEPTQLPRPARARTRGRSRKQRPQFRNPPLLTPQAPLPLPVRYKPTPLRAMATADSIATTEGNRRFNNWIDEQLAHGDYQATVLTAPRNPEERRLLDGGLGIFTSTERGQMARPFRLSPAVDAMPDVVSYSDHRSLHLLTPSAAPVQNTPWRGYATGADIAVSFPSYTMETNSGPVTLDTSN